MAKINLDGGHSIDGKLFRKNLMEWGQRYFRPFQWRVTEDPYLILIAEVMLHRTRASQVEPVYKKFIEHYPEILTLARAKKDELSEILYPLGLRWRTNLLSEMTADIVARFGGKVPEEKDDLMGLPGVSDYIASAVRCFAWNYPEPLVDTNTVRIIGRVFGLEIKDSSRRNPRFRELIASNVDHYEPRKYNYALLDLADRVCFKVKEPECNYCPIQESCLYGVQ
ncbi:DNA-binding protein [Nitrospiraceae bacterium HYJII51-Mn-bac16s-1-B09]|uniref:DNA-binding protein n=2 Tax=Candidatus Manganitrophus noduliformans TaxID=2606439 RepID=A0A7X6DQ52_9BACT|nr:DNA-binding protein [Candidatus Manganitrophus noduliformans]